MSRRRDAGANPRRKPHGQERFADHERGTVVRAQQQLAAAPDERRADGHGLSAAADHRPSEDHRRRAVLRQPHQLYGSVHDCG